ncbi:hypothetical protein CPB85DRAFT_1296929 [Mucidula mucida]|nr:hypothetical protein CPB85DRAFT_1296929 [Mucidula mucida]
MLAVTLALLLLSLAVPLILAFGETLIWGFNDQWFCEVANEPTTLYQFVDATAVKEFAQAMTGGKDAVITALDAGDIFTTLDGNSGELVYTLLFSTDSLSYWTDEYVVVNGADLMDKIVDLGEWMLELLAAYAKNVTTNSTSNVAEPDFQIQFENFSPTSLLVGEWECDIDAVLGTIITSPSGMLQSTGGVESLAWYQTLSVIAVDGEGFVEWVDPNTGYWFGVDIHVPYQMFGIRTAPYYRVAYGFPNNSSNAHFFKPPGGPSAVYTFPQELGYNITVRPVAAHTSLFLTVTISP